MTQGGKEMMVGRWRSMLGRLDDRDADQSYSRLSQLLYGLVSKFPLTYHGEIINEGSVTFNIGCEGTGLKLPTCHVETDRAVNSVTKWTT
jgi:hypothetical protein